MVPAAMLPGAARAGHTEGIRALRIGAPARMATPATDLPGVSRSTAARSGPGFPGREASRGGSPVTAAWRGGELGCPGYPGRPRPGGTSPCRALKASCRIAVAKVTGTWLLRRCQYCLRDRDPLPGSGVHSGKPAGVLPHVSAHENSVSIELARIGEIVRLLLSGTRTQSPSNPSVKYEIGIAATKEMLSTSGHIFAFQPESEQGGPGWLPDECLILVASRFALSLPRLGLPVRMGSPGIGIRRQPPAAGLASRGPDSKCRPLFSAARPATRLAGVCLLPELEPARQACVAMASRSPRVNEPSTDRACAGTWRRLEHNAGRNGNSGTALDGCPGSAFRSSVEEGIGIFHRVTGKAADCEEPLMPRGVRSLRFGIEVHNPHGIPVGIVVAGGTPSFAARPVARPRSPAAAGRRAHESIRRFPAMPGGVQFSRATVPRALRR